MLSVSSPYPDSVERLSFMAVAIPDLFNEEYTCRRNIGNYCVNHYPVQPAEMIKTLNIADQISAVRGCKVNNTIL